MMEPTTPSSSSSSPPATHSPAIPTYVLRGHTAPIHALHFFQANVYLASGDADGWVVVWSVASKRAVAVWQAHAGSILGLRAWGGGRVVTHGRDHKLRVWWVGEGELGGLDARLPVDRDSGGGDGDGDGGRREPWLLHSLSVNALNFCAFAMCEGDDEGEKGVSRSSDMLGAAVTTTTVTEGSDGLRQQGGFRPVLLAVPHALDSGGIDFFHLPSEHRLSTLQADKQIKTGMVMALALFRNPVTEQLTVISGYEAGHTMVHVRKALANPKDPWLWSKILVSQPHSQPLLSLEISPDSTYFFTSSADAVLAKFFVPSSSTTSNVEQKPSKILNTKHAGQQGLSVRSDGKILATAGWDARIRVYSTKTMKELAVLKWHKDGCYTVNFATIPHGPGSEPAKTVEDRSEIATIGNGSALDIIKQQRSTKAQTTHWLAAGGKDGKISLWDIY